MVRAAAYLGLSVRRRRELHHRACTVIEGWGDSIPLADPVSTLAFHATGAESPDLIVKWNRLAAEAAVARGAMEVAEQLLTDVVAAQPATGAPTADRCATPTRARHRRRAGRAPRGLPRRPRRGAQAGGRERAGSDRHRSCPSAREARPVPLLASGDSPRTEGASGSDPDEAICSSPGRPCAASSATGRGVCASRRTCSPPAIVSAILASAPRRTCFRSGAAAVSGCPNARSTRQAAMELLTELDDSLGRGNLFLNRGVSVWREGRVQDAIADFGASSECYARSGDVVGAAMADNNLAEILTLQVRLDPAEKLLTNALRVQRAANYMHGEMATISGLSRVCCVAGRLGSGVRAAVDRIVGLPRPGGERLHPRLAGPPRRDPRARRRRRRRAGGRRFRRGDAHQARPRAGGAGDAGPPPGPGSAATRDARRKRCNRSSTRCRWRRTRDASTRSRSAHWFSAGYATTGNRSARRREQLDQLGVLDVPPGC